jgi:hypothetical protein
VVKFARFTPTQKGLRRCAPPEEAAPAFFKIVHIILRQDIKSFFLPTKIKSVFSQSKGLKLKQIRQRKEVFGAKIIIIIIIVTVTKKLFSIYKVLLLL